MTENIGYADLNLRHALTSNHINENAWRRLFVYATQSKWTEAMEEYRQQPLLSLEKITADGDTALHIAVQDGNEGVVKEMLELIRRHAQHKVSLELRNEQGNTPLHLAASIGNASMCKYIKTKGGDRLLDIRNEDWETPLFSAARHGKIEAFRCLQRKDSDSYPFRNKKGETILHCAMAGGHFKLAFLIIETYENLGMAYDENGVSPLHLLANQPTAFRSGTRLTLIDKLIYDCLVVLPSRSGDGDKSYNSAEREKTENNTVHFDEENQPTREHGQDINAPTTLTGPRKRNIPVNYDTCFSSIMLLIKTILGILFNVIGGGYVSKIRQKREKHVLAARILEKLIVDIRKDPPYKDGTILYQWETRDDFLPVEPGPNRLWKLADELPDLLPPDMSAKTLGCENSSIEEIGDTDMIMRKLLNEAQRSTALTGKLLKEARTCTNLIHKLYQAAPMDRLPGSLNDGHEELVLEDYASRKLETLILVAAKNGITEIVDKILEISPWSILDLDSKGKNVVLSAVEHRQTQLYSLYEKLASLKFLHGRAFRVVDDEGNNALHLAATLSHYQPYPFAAVQMQWEIKWYEYVKKSLPQYLVSGRNKANKTPKDVFMESHKHLVEEGGKWLTSTSKSCSVVATIITTVAFATTASVPGGLKERSSSPNLEEHPGFIVFAVSSLVALSFSVTSVITFLIILTSRHQQNDFRRELPRKLLLGLTSLFISLGVMLVCFCAAHFFLLKDKLKLAAVPLYAVASVPVIFFAIMQFPFYFDLILATFRKVP